MSIKLMTIVWDIQFPTQAQKLIALKLADYASDTGNSVYPSNESLARRAGCDERTVQRTLKAFRDCGILSLVREGGKGPKDTNEWQLNVRLLVTLRDGEASIVGGSQTLEIQGIEDVDNMGDSKSPIDDSMSPLDGLRVTSEAKRVTPVSAKGDTSVTQSVTIHHIEPSVRASAREQGISKFDLKGEVAQEPILLLRGDPLWRSWIEHVKSYVSVSAANAFEKEGAMVVYSRQPTIASSKPKLAPLEGHPKRVALERARTLSAKSKAMSGDAA